MTDSKQGTEESIKEPTVIDSATAMAAIENDRKNRVNAAMTEIQDVLKRHRCHIAGQIKKVEIAKGVWGDFADAVVLPSE